MAEAVLAELAKILLAIYSEASKASENKKTLQNLANKARVMEPQLSAIREKLRSASEHHVIPALSHFHSTLTSVLALIEKRGKARSSIRLPLDALIGRAAKVQAEIAGAESNLFQALQMVIGALQIQNVQLVEEMGQQFKDAVQISEVPSNFYPSQHSWSLRLEDLEYKKKRGDKPVDEIVLGDGGFGIVFAALYKPSGVLVAVKEPHNTYALDSDQALRRAFLREVDNHFKLHHLNVITLVGAIVADGDGVSCYMIVTEILCQSLHDFLKTPQAHSAISRDQIIRGIAEGLAYLHASRIIHRDIKPQVFCVESLKRQLCSYFVV